MTKQDYTDRVDDYNDLHPQSPPARVWSPFQQAIFDAVAEQPPKNILIQAVAGSGKTTTIVEAMKYGGTRPAFLAFNKSIAMEIQSRVTSGEVKTLNALGHKMVMQNLRGSELDARKNIQILGKLMGDQSPEFKEYAYTLSRVIGLAKSACLPAWDSDLPSSMEEIVDNFQMDIPSDMVNTLCGIAAHAMREGWEDTATFDFDDQLYWPVMRKWVFPRFTDVFVDECQDLNSIQHQMLARLAAQGARIVAVGDRHQAIYGFRGALSDSMDQLRRQFNMVELPLSVTYRCGSRITQLAQSYCPSIECLPSQHMGEVEYVNSDEGETDPKLFPAGTLVICRNNAPLFRAIMRHVRAKSPCKVLSNFLESFQSFIRNLKAKDMPELLMKLDQWYDRERAAAEKKRFKGKLYGIQDRYDTVRALAKEFSDIDTMLRTVAKLSEGSGGPIFSTVHKAKGLEAAEVYILRPDLIPAPYCDGEDQLKQEYNLLYVAITRAKHKLTFGAKLARD